MEGSRSKRALGLKDRSSEEIPEMEDNRSEKIPEMLTVKEVSERTGMSYGTIRRFCLKHKIVYIKTGWRYLINWQSVLDYFNRGELDTKVDGEAAADNDEWRPGSY